MSPDDSELMLWALAHGWSVKVFAGHAPGSLWRDPARRRYLVHGADPAHELPVLSDEVRALMGAARAFASPSPQRLRAG